MKPAIHSRHARELQHRSNRDGHRCGDQRRKPWFGALLQDATAGIALYPGQDWSAWDATPQIGDSLSVTGEITEYNGLLEVGPDLTAVEFYGAGTLPEPLEITPAQMGENLEGQLVRVNGVTFPLAGTFFIGNNTYDFTASGETGVITCARATVWWARS